MTTFAYTALAKDGKRTSGTLSADNRAAALTMVLQRGLSPIESVEITDETLQAFMLRKLQ